jgi:hypothetical protein
LTAAERGSDCGEAVRAEIGGLRARGLTARHLVGGMIFAGIGLAALGDLWEGGLPIWDDSGPGPSFFPLVLAVLLVVLGAVFSATRARAQAEAADGEEEVGFARPQTIKYVVLLLVAIALFPILGGLISLSLFVIAEVRWIERSSNWIALLMGVVTFAAVWLIFVKLLSVPLPTGLLPDSFG